MDALSGIIGNIMEQRHRSNPAPSPTTRTLSRRGMLPPIDVVRTALDQLHACYPGAHQWPERRDPAAWAELAEQWRRGLCGMTGEDVADAAAHYPRSADGRFPPQPAGLFQALKELRDQEAYHTMLRRTSGRGTARRLPSEIERAGADVVASHMAEIRRILRRAANAAPVPA